MAKESAEADDQSDDGQAQSFLHHQPDDVARGGAEGEANPEFIGALRDAVGDDAVDAHAGEGEREPGETAEQIHRETAIGGGVGEQFGVGLDLIDRQAGIERMNRRDQFGAQDSRPDASCARSWS